MRVKAYMAAYYLAQAVYQSYMSLFYRARGLDAAGLGALYALAAAASIPGQLLFGAAADRARVPGRVLRALLLFSAALLLLQALRARRLRPVCPGGAVRLCLYAGAAHRRRPRPGTPCARRQALRPRAADGRAGLRGLGARLRLFARRLGAGRAGGARGGGADAVRAACLLPARRREAPARRSAPAAPAQGPEASAPAPLRPPRAGDDGLLLRLFPHALSANCPGRRARCWAGRTSSPRWRRVPFLLVGDRLFARWGAAGTVAVATLALGARWLLTGLGESVCALLAAQLLHGLGYIAISLSMALYIRRAVAREAQASGQALLNVFCYGLARVLGNCAGRRGGARLRRGGRLRRLRAVVLSVPGGLFPVWKEAFCNSRRDML